MITCKECGAAVSDTALTCPTCGVQLRKPKRGFFGLLFKWTFILFNCLMAFWLFSYFVEIGSMVDASMSEAEQAGAAIGGTIGTGMLLSVWGFGDLILGILVLFTRAK